MMLTLQIAVGLWLGGLFLIGTCWAFIEVAAYVDRKRQYGEPWWRALIRRRGSA